MTPLDKAPWEASSEPPGSLAWKMGEGEVFLDRWLAAVLAMSHEQRANMLDAKNAPPRWRALVSRMVSEYGSETA